MGARRFLFRDCGWMMACPTTCRCPGSWSDRDPRSSGPCCRDPGNDRDRARGLSRKIDPWISPGAACVAARPPPRRGIWIWNNERSCALVYTSITKCLVKGELSQAFDLIDVMCIFNTSRARETASSCEDYQVSHRQLLYILIEGCL